MDGESRLYRILTIIEKNNITTLQAIADKLEVSTKTIKNEIKELNKMLQSHALIDIKENKYKLYILNDIRYDQIKEHLLHQNSFFNSQKNRIAYIFYELINSNHYYLTDDLIEHLNIGRTSFMNDLKILREKLARYNISIIGKTNKGLSVSGNEMDIRLYILNELYSLIYIDYSLDKEVFNLVNSINSSLFLNYETRDYFFKFLIVSIDRIQHGYSLNNLYPTYQNLKNTTIYAFINNIVNKIGNILHITFNENEKVFMTIPLVSMRTPIKLETSNDLIIPKETMELVHNMIALIKLKFNISLIPGDFLLEFQHHIFFMINRLKYGIKIKNPILEDIQEKYSLAYTMAEVISELITSTLKKTVPKEEIGYIAMYLGLFLSESLHNTDKIYKVAIICSTGILSARMIESQIRKVLSSEISVDIFSENEITSELINQYHLAFSIVKLTFKIETPIIYVKEIFDEFEFRKKLEYIKYTKNLNIPIKHGIHSILLSILEKDLFFTLDNKKSYDENLRIMTDKLVNKHYVDSNFYTRLKHREAMATMIFDKGIAIPHDVNYNNHKVIFALGVFPDELKVNKNTSVQLIFLLGIPDEVGIYEKLIVRIYNEIIHIAKDKNKVKEIARITKYDDFVHYMITQNNVI